MRAERAHLRAGYVVIAALFAAGCGSGGSSATATTVARPTVRSTLDGRATLPLRIHWMATPGVSSGQVAEVDFLIDGRLGWVEHAAPYFYGDDGNWLVTSFLKPGSHAFTVKVMTIDGKTATDTVRATVGTPPPPARELRATWTRMVTPADVQKSTSGQPPPAGRWKLRIAPSGWQLLDPTPNASWGLFDVEYGAGHTLQLRPTIEYPPYPNYNNGGFCHDTDPLFDWTYTVAPRGRTLTLHPNGSDPCGDRAAILEGVWTRASTR